MSEDMRELKAAAEKARDLWWRELSKRGDPLKQTDLFRAFDAGFIAATLFERERQ